MPPIPIYRRRLFARPGRPSSLLLALAVCAIVMGATGACGTGPGPGDDGIGVANGLAHPSVGTFSPDFVAQDPSGSWLPLSTVRDKPVALLFFRPGASFALEVAREMSRFRDDPAYAPTFFLGISPDTAENNTRFRETNRLSLPILRDPGSILRSFGIGEATTVILLDTDHVIRFRLDGFVGRFFRPRIEATRSALQSLPRLPRLTAEPLDIAYTENPRAPLFLARDLDGNPIDLADLKGKVVVLSFFDQECPHCKKDLPRMMPVLEEMRERGVVAIGVTSRDVGHGLRAFLGENGVEFPVILDKEREIFRKYESTRTPDTFIIDREGFIRFREHGDRPDRAEVLRLQLHLALDEESPSEIAAALPADRYLGDAVCRSCHASEYRDWLMTPHSIAWESLLAGDRWRDAECVRCHVTAQDEQGGFRDPETTPQMVNVQCEVCHSRGGGHPGDAGIDIDTVSAACIGCHKGEFVLNFDLDEALALVAHQDQPDLDRMFQYSGMQRQRLDQVNTRRLEKFKSGVAYVGSDACRDCHREQHDQWVRSPHAGAFARLLRARRNADRACTRCHTTGMGFPGGFGDEGATSPMTNVQCEVCHGPGADHVEAPPELKKGTIYGITNQCSFCIIQGVCMSCHDRENDPDFDIETDLPLVTH